MDVSATLRGRLVFVVDDEPLEVDVLREFLEGEGCRVVGSDDSRQMARLLEINRPDVLIADVMMPGIDGWELLRRMRDTELNGDTPVIFLTCLAAEDDEPQFTRGHGRCHVLAKPVLRDRLIACVRECLGIS
jgi:CheY-like chemotaxis protein